MTVQLALGTALTVVGLLVAGFAAWVRWSLRSAITQTIRDVVNGRIDRVHDDVRRLNTWAGSHDRRHGHEQRQLIAALNRHGISPPDGWD